MSHMTMMKAAMIGRIPCGESVAAAIAEPFEQDQSEVPGEIADNVVRWHDQERDGPELRPQSIRIVIVPNGKPVAIEDVS